MSGRSKNHSFRENRFWMTWVNLPRGERHTFCLPSLWRHRIHSCHPGDTSHREAEPVPLVCHPGQDGARHPWQTQAGDRPLSSIRSAPTKKTHAQPPSPMDYILNCRMNYVQITQYIDGNFTPQIHGDSVKRMVRNKVHPLQGCAPRERAWFHMRIHLHL